MNLLINNIGQLVTVASHGKRVKTGEEMRSLGVLSDASLLIENGIIAKIAKKDELTPPEDFDVIDAEGRTVLPGFVDSHTHTVFAGTRENEFAMRAEGKSYQEIAEAGGGIISTMRATREASKKDLYHLAERRLDDMMRYGTTTVEIKSGYGLSPEAEIKILEVIHDLQRDHYATVVGTFLGAHAFPPEYKDDKQGYVDRICDYMMPYIAEKKLATFVDVFCEQGYFDLHFTEQIILEAKRHGLIPKLHADQLNAFGAVELGAKHNAISVDHLEKTNESGIAALKNSQTIATVLPGCSLFLNHPYAPARAIIDAGIPLVLATDFNPGSQMSYSMQMMLTLACTQMRMTPEEAITAATFNGAAALGLSAEIGSIEIGKQADVVIYDVHDYRFIPYHYGMNHVWKVVKNGVMLEF
ncbi:MAG: imidazolonepropionase [Ignavibacteriales bacterium]|nr:imidazolonepropionase [Ignavibacteriales bacterium]